MRVILNLLIYCALTLGAYVFLNFPSPWKIRRHSQISTFFKALPSFSQSGNMQILSCHDGDTCRAQDSSDKLHVLRLLGIDAPEMPKNAFSGSKAWKGQVYAQESSEYLNKRVKGQTLWIQNFGMDRYGRDLALLFEDKNSTKSINEELVEKGFAFAYRGKMEEKNLQQKFVQVEEESKIRKKGLWALKEQPLEPRQYRAQYR